jgi:ABC-type multidrug transport system ATPase subunit
MSEEILRALMQLFAILAKQEGVESDEMEYVRGFLTQQLNDEDVHKYYALFEEYAEINVSEEEGEKKPKLTSVKDSVRILGLCKKINKTLNQSQKIVVLVRLFELINARQKFTDQRMAIINTSAEVFNVSKEEFKGIEEFVLNNDPSKVVDSNILVVSDKRLEKLESKHVYTEKLDGYIFILRIPSVDLYFLKYTGSEDLFLNGLGLNNRRIYLFANGSTIKLPKGKPVYYSDIAAHFLSELHSSRISFEVKDLEFRFPNGNIGVQQTSFAENQGRLIGIMGASGAGKTTLLNVLCGLEQPTKGQVLINGIDLHRQKKDVEGVIGLIPQDDLLIEELTVFENLYYAAKLCFKDKKENEIVELVNKTLTSLGLYDRRDLKVGSPLNKFISGGQRKRLNIALELIREPSILFVDEPTSGLSSSDSVNVMDLLRELTLKGKLIFVVIHQPSSEIYKMFDKMVILDTGGYTVYYGNPVEAVMYFKRLDAQINSEVGECPTCGNVNPELLFNIIEARVVDEFGNYTQNRKVNPPRWEELYHEHIKPEETDIISDPPPRNLNIPNWLRQIGIYIRRDILSKISNRQYVALNLLEAPVLGLILSYIIRYISDPASNVYIFRENENIPIFIFMSLIVALFLGLMVSAEEIFRDRKILKRESFLNLSRSGYLVSKVTILLLISAIQSFAFIIIASNILGLQTMTFYYWFAMFSTAAFANLLGLNISSAFNSAVTIYIILPLLMIPMMVLSGAMFNFEKLNRSVGSVDKVPLIADMMVTKWSYEALMVHQFKDNNFEKRFYDIDKEVSNNDYMVSDYLPELSKRLKAVQEAKIGQGDTKNLNGNLRLLKNEVSLQLVKVPEVEFRHVDKLTPEGYTTDVGNMLSDYLAELKGYYEKRFNLYNSKRENIISYFLSTQGNKFYAVKNAFENENVADNVKKAFEKNRILEYDGRLIRQKDPVFVDPRVTGFFSFRAHFYAPRKYFAGQYWDTYWFNMSFIWFMTFLMYVTLYFDLLKRLLTSFEKLKWRKN